MKRILSMIVLVACCILQGCVKDQIMTRTTVLSSGIQNQGRGKGKHQKQQSH